MELAHTIEFKASGRGKARCAPNPDFPEGKPVDCSEGKVACAVELPYPAPECGVWIVRCKACGMSVGITAAGRLDDPKMVKMPCKEERNE